MAVLIRLKIHHKNRFKKNNTWVQSVWAAAEGKLGGLEMIS